MNVNSKIQIRYGPILLFALMIPFVVIFAILVVGPYFGNMDDGRLLTYATGGGPFQFANDLAGGTGTGFIRWSSMFLIWPIYWLGSVAGSTWFFVANAVLVFVCTSIFGLSLARLMGWKNSWVLLSFIAAAFTWPYSAELFFFPSLSEKGIILGAGLLFWWVSQAPRFESRLFYWMSFIAVVAFAFSSKTQIVVFIPAIIFSLWVKHPSTHASLSIRRRILVTCTLFLFSASALFLALNGSYTQSTQGSVDLDFLRDTRFLLLISISGLYALALLIRARLAINCFMDWVPMVMLLSISGAFVVWDIRNYFLAIAGVMVGSAVGTIVGWMQPSSKQVGVAIALSIVACAWLLIRLPTVFGSLASVGDFLTDPIIQRLETEHAAVYVTCMEAPDHYNKYAADKEINGFEFVFLGDRESLLTSDKNSNSEFVLADSRLCPWTRESTNAQVVWTNGTQGAFQLYELSN